MPRNKGTTATEVARQQHSYRLASKWAVVTGGNSGIGLETCRALSAAGANVVLCSRSIAAGEKVAAELRTTGDKGAIVVEQLDLADLDNVAHFAARMAQRLPGGAPDLLVLNAGVAATPRGSKTVDGFELQIGTNYIGHQALVQALLPRMRALEVERGAAAAGRIVVLTSISHKLAKIDLEDLNFERRQYSPWLGYAQSKLACLLMAKELARRLHAGGSAIKVAAVHPGIIFTPITRHSKSGCCGSLVRAFLTPMSKTPEQGAATTVYACVADYPSGAYLAECAVAKPSRSALDAKLGEALFRKAEDMISESMRVAAKDKSTGGEEVYAQATMNATPASSPVNWHGSQQEN